MKAFVTGITGFAGTHLAEHLLASGDVLLGCSRDGRWKAHTPDALRSLPVLAWDVASAISEESRRALAAFEPDCLFHLAAVSVPRECGTEEPTSYAWEANVQGTQAVLRLAASLSRRPRVLLVSSCHVYAPVSRQRPTVAEDAPTGPTAGYGKTKLAAEAALLRAVTEEGLDAVIARAFQHAGPRQDARLALSEWCRQLLAPEADAVRVRSLDSYFDISDVRDVVRAYRLLSDPRPRRRDLQRRQRRLPEERRPAGPAADADGLPPSRDRNDLGGDPATHRRRDATLPSHALAAAGPHHADSCGYGSLLAVAGRAAQLAKSAS